MAAKKDAPPLRGAKLIKKALTSAGAVIPTPEPVVGAKKLKLPNGEPLSPAMKELLTFDGSWLAIDYDDEEFEIEAAALEDIIEESFGEAAVVAFAEATELLGEDLVAFGCDRGRPAFLYVGEVDDAGEYPVLELSFEDGIARIGGFVPFDVWVAQELGGLERGKDIGDVPAEYAALPKAAAEANGDGRVVFSPKAGVAEADDQDEDE
jgi:hypothetical protein